MRPNTSRMLMGTTLPEWLSVLARQLRDEGRDATLASIPLSLLLEEVIDIGAAIRDGRGGPNKDNLHTLQQDLRIAIKQLGSNVRQAVSTGLDQFQRNTLGAIPRLLRDAEGSRIVVASAESLFEELLSDAGVGAMWDDVVAAYRKPEPIAVAEMRVAQLVDAAARRGWEWDTLYRMLSSLIGDDYFAIRQAGVAVPDLSTTQEYRDFSSGQNDEQRLALCRAVICGAAPTGALTVWLAYENAWLPDQPYLKIENVEFFAHQLFDQGRYIGPDQWKPAEFSDPEYEFDKMPDKDYVLARVDLGLDTTGHAGRRAVEIVSHLITIAATNSKWLRMDGERLYQQDLGWYGSTGYMTSEQQAQIAKLSHPTTEPTGYALTQITPALTQALSARDPRALAGAKEAAWHKTVRELVDPEQRIALGIRSLERILPATRDDRHPWTKSAQRYLKGAWVRNEVWQAIFDAGYWGVNALADRRNQFPRPLWDHYSALLFPGIGTGRFEVDRREICVNTVALAELLPDSSLERRQLEELAGRFATGFAALAWLDEMEAAFDRFIGRAARQRNAIIHGTPASIGVVETVDRFVGQLGQLAVSALLRSVAKGTEGDALLEVEAVDYARLRQAVRESDDPLLLTAF